MHIVHVILEEGFRCKQHVQNYMYMYMYMYVHVRMDTIWTNTPGTLHAIFVVFPDGPVTAKFTRAHNNYFLNSVANGNLQSAKIVSAKRSRLL